MTQVTIVTGCAGAGKTERLLAGYQAAISRAQTERRPLSTLWLTPTRRIQQTIAQRIVVSSGHTCFTPNVLTFDRFAEKILTAAGRQASPISPVIKRLLLRRIAQELMGQGELRHFQSIAGMTGFLDVVSSFISELKREEIWPEEFVAACQQRTSAFARRDLELGLIYARYQRHLTEQNWYDNEGRFWLARTALGEGVRGPFAGVRHLAVDGFADFTQTQYEILGYLSAWIEEISISLPVEQPLTRCDLFAKPHAAIARIREHLPDGVSWHIESLRPAPLNETLPHSPRADSIRVIAARLFSNPRSVESTSASSGLEVIAASGQFGEWEAIARRIKGLLGNGSAAQVQTSQILPTTRPQQIVIGLRSIADDGPRLQAYLQAAGLPAWCEAELPFISSSIVKFVSSLLQFELEDWPFERLMSLLDSNFFQPNWTELAQGRAIRAVASLLRRLRLNGGRVSILRVLARQASDSASMSVESSRNSQLDLASLASPLLVRLAKSLEKLRRPHTLSDWADVLAATADDLCFPKPSTATSDRRTDNEARDWDLLQRILRTAAEADQRLVREAKPRTLTLGEFASELRDLLSHETLSPLSEPTGTIRILSIEQIRNLDVPHLILVGLTEQSFPQNRSDDCLFSESERQDFNSRGVALRHRSGLHADEMFLFYSVVTRARQSLTLSYPAVNSKGQPVFPSPYVTALMSLFSHDALKTNYDGQLDPVPDIDRALTLTDLRLTSMSLAADGHPELLRSLLEVSEPGRAGHSSSRQLPTDIDEVRRVNGTAGISPSLEEELDITRSAVWNTLAACEVANHRFHQRGFTGYEGQLELSQNLAGLRQRFGSQHQFSATELEAYARCPFQFWLSNVLKIAPVESPEEGTDYAGRGTLLHEVLAKLLIEGLLNSEPELLQRRFQELVESQLDCQISETELQQAMVDVERLVLAEWGHVFAKQQSEYTTKIGDVLDDAKPFAAEIPFGRLPDSPFPAEVSNPPIEFGHGDDAVKLRGRIDRVDVGTFEGHQAYIVVDYKTGQRPKMSNDDLLTGRSIQLALYLLAMKRLGMVGPDAIPYQMGYWALQDTGFKQGVGRSKIEPLDPIWIQSLEQLLDEVLPRLAEGIRSGRFVVENDDPHCTGRCPFRTVCRVGQLRPISELLGKQSPVAHDPTADGGMQGGSFAPGGVVGRKPAERRSDVQ